MNFSARKQDYFVHLGMWSGFRRGVLATTVLLDHIGGKPVVLCSEDGMIAFVSTTCHITFSSATESTVLKVSAKDTHICSYEAISFGNLQDIQHVSLLSLLHF